jgi:hypothetical protein
LISGYDVKFDDVYWQGLIELEVFFVILGESSGAEAPVGTGLAVRSAD